MKKREQNKKNLYATMSADSLIRTPGQMIANYKWYALASAVKDETLALELMQEILKENNGRFED